jgi:hypothetical protein
MEKWFNIFLEIFCDTYDRIYGRPNPTVYIDEMREAFLLQIQKRLK